VLTHRGGDSACRQNRASMSAPPSGGPADATGIGGALGGVVIAVVPAALAYFIGWTYLYYYLLEFGINVSELDLGVEAILIYAVPPTLSVVRHYWLPVLAILVVAYFLMAYKHLLPWLRMNPNFYARIRGLHPVAKGVAWFLVLVLAVAILTPLIQSVAIQRADDKWTRTGTRLRAPIEAPTTSSSYEDYQSCMSRLGLDLVFADKNVYYLLCVSQINDDSGVVYEVRRAESKLASVRWSRRNAKEGNRP